MITVPPTSFMSLATNPSQLPSTSKVPKDSNAVFRHVADYLPLKQRHHLLLINKELKGRLTMLNGRLRHPFNKTLLGYYNNLLKCAASFLQWKDRDSLFVERIDSNRGALFLVNKELNKRLWAIRIQEDVPYLYPIYRNTLYGRAPSNLHHKRLSEAAKFVNAKLNKQPLPESCINWTVSIEDDQTIVRDEQGRQVYYSCEPRNLFTVRLAFRGSLLGCMPIPLDPLFPSATQKTVALTNFYRKTRTFLLQRGWITGCRRERRLIYIVGEKHRPEPQDIELFLEALARQGRIAFFREGIPRHPDAEAHLKHSCSSPDSHIFGLERSGLFALASCMVALDQVKSTEVVHLLKTLYWNLKWTKNGQALWNKVFPSIGFAHPLTKAFQDLGLHDEVNERVCYQILRQVDCFNRLSVLGKEILTRYSKLGLTDTEKAELSECLDASDALNPVIYKKWFHRLQDKRNVTFARSILSQLPSLPKDLPVVAYVGATHLCGVWQQLQLPVPHETSAVIGFANSSEFANKFHQNR